jgi:peptide/nickel transport system permease protein
MNLRGWRPGPLRPLLIAVPLLLGVTLISFTLTVYLGPDPAWALAGPNPTAQEIAQLSEQLGQDRAFAVRYLEFVQRLARFDLGHTQSSGESINGLLARTIPVSLLALLPGLLIGTFIALLLAMLSAWYQSGWPDRLIAGLSITSMSLSVVVVIIACQAILAVWLGWLPVRGWSTDSPAAYLRHVSLPTLAIVFVSIGYHIRFFRATLIEAMRSDHVLTARAFGASPARIMLAHVLGNSLLPITTRLIFSLPLLAVSGSLVIESHFGIPGVGRVTYEAILSGDQPVLMAVVSFSAILFVLAMSLADALYRLVDPRLREP